MRGGASVGCSGPGLALLLGLGACAMLRLAPDPSAPSVRLARLSGRRRGGRSRLPAAGAGFLGCGGARGPGAALPAAGLPRRAGLGRAAAPGPGRRRGPALGARSEAALGRWDRCLARLASLRQPGRPAALSLRGEALAAQGDPGAPQALQRALSACAGTRLEAVTALLARGRERRGGDEDAERLYKRAEKVDPSYTLVNLRWPPCTGARSAGRRPASAWSAPAAWTRRPRSAPGAQRAAGGAARAAPRAQARRGPQGQALPGPRQPGRGALAAARRAGGAGGLLADAPRFKCRLGGTCGRSQAGASCPPTALGGPPRPPRLGLHAAEPRRRAQAHGLGWRRAAGAAGPASTFGSSKWTTGPAISGRPAGPLLPRQLGAAAARPASPWSTCWPRAVPAQRRAQRGPGPLARAALRSQAIAARTDAWRSLGRFQSRGYDLCPTVLCASTRAWAPRTRAPRPP